MAISEIRHVFTPKQTSATWFTFNYTLLSSIGYNQALSPFIFHVKACTDAHVLLMDFDSQTAPGNIYEIVIGGWNNSKTVLRTAKQSDPVKEYVENYLLNCDNYRTFTITWDTSGSVHLFKHVADNKEDILSWSNPNPFIVSYIGVSTGPAGDGYWNITIPVTTTSTTTTTTTTPTTAVTTTTAAAAAAAAATAATATTTTPTFTTSELSVQNTTSTGTSTPTVPTSAVSDEDSNTTESATACPCECPKPNSNRTRNYTQDQLKEVMEKLRTELSVVKKTTSKHTR
ncbi:C3 and PZP-like alpha-2-macroglobulin domain-containing protein 8 [Argopecten irradians]|uniref:C3 and PZP-like alpha-2-macroglobulin domain-containing protein 8 n=1 Tax=Argopecten irradians TaxID=31199 RepID=UPI00370FEA95